jgi:ATPase subunit of ABC transporter with duplicated ATPase domains
VLDEPTNYLDREALGALATALKEYQVRMSQDRGLLAPIASLLIGTTQQRGPCERRCVVKVD